MRSQPNFSLTEGIRDLRPTPLKKKMWAGAFQWTAPKWAGLLVTEI